MICSESRRLTIDEKKLKSRLIGRVAHQEKRFGNVCREAVEAALGDLSGKSAGAETSFRNTMKAFNPNARRIYFVSATEKTAFFALNDEERHQHMARANRQAYEQEVSAQAEAQCAAQAEWEANYGHLSHEEAMQKHAKEFRAEVEEGREIAAAKNLKKVLTSQSTEIKMQDPIKKAPPEDDSPVVGISTSPFKAGETANIMVAGTSIMAVEDSSWRTHMGVYLHEARRLGIEVPDKLLIHAGQLFWKDGKVVEARLSGYVVTGEPDADGKADTMGWQTPAPPHFTRGTQGELMLAPEDAGRTHMSVFFTESPETPGKTLMVVTLDLTENHRISETRLA